MLSAFTAFFSRPKSIQFAALRKAGTFERFDVFASIKPVIIPGAHRFRNQMAALGVLYYQIKDKL